MYILLIVSGLGCLISYIFQAFLADSQLSYEYPEKFLVKNKFILKYFCNPEKPITKHYTILHFILLFYFIIIMILHLTYWISGLNFVLQNPEFIKYNLIGLAILGGIFCLIAAFLRHKYIKF